jgi:hypothetical protein
VTPEVDETQERGRNKGGSRVVAHGRAGMVRVLVLRGGANESLNTRVGLHWWGHVG